MLGFKNVLVGYNKILQRVLGTMLDYHGIRAKLTQYKKI